MTSRRCKRLLLLGCLLAGVPACVAVADEAPATKADQSKPGQKADQAKKLRSIEEILAADEANSADYDEPVRCVPRWQYEHTEIINERYVAFKGHAGKIWVNELRRECTGLTRNDILKFSGTASQICELDSFDVLDRFGFIGPTLSCTLGKFHPVTKVQLDSIRQSLQSKR